MRGCIYVCVCPLDVPWHVNTRLTHKELLNPDNPVPRIAPVQQLNRERTNSAFRCNLGLWSVAGVDVSTKAVIVFIRTASRSFVPGDVTVRRTIHMFSVGTSNAGDRVMYVPTAFSRTCGDGGTVGPSSTTSPELSGRALERSDPNSRSETWVRNSSHRRTREILTSTWIHKLPLPPDDSGHVRRRSRAPSQSSCEL